MVSMTQLSQKRAQTFDSVKETARGLFGNGSNRYDFPDTDARNSNNSQRDGETEHLFSQPSPSPSTDTFPVSLRASMSSYSSLTDSSAPITPSDSLSFPMFPLEVIDEHSSGITYGYLTSPLHGGADIPSISIIPEQRSNSGRPPLKLMSVPTTITSTQPTTPSSTSASTSHSPVTSSSSQSSVHRLLAKISFVKDSKEENFTNLHLTKRDPRSTRTSDTRNAMTRPCSAAL
ncbi:hypothetical protein JOM56_010508 [Amanita muscaria]